MAVNTLVRFSANVVDSEGKKGSVLSHAYVDDASTIAQINTALTAYLAALYPCTDAGISEGSVTVLSGNVLSTYPVTASGEELEDTGNLDFAVATVPYHWGLTILALKPSVLTGDQITTGSPPISTLSSLMVGAVLGGHYTDRSARNLTALAYSFQGNRKHRRKLHEISMKVE